MNVNRRNSNPLVMMNTGFEKPVKANTRFVIMLRKKNTKAIIFTLTPLRSASKEVPIAVPSVIESIMKLPIASTNACSEFAIEKLQ